MKARVALGTISLCVAALCIGLFVKMLGPGPESLVFQFMSLSAMGFWGGIGGFTLWDCWDEKRRAEEEARRIKRITRFAGWA